MRHRRKEQREMDRERSCCAADGRPANGSLPQERKTRRLRRVLISLAAAAGCFAASILFRRLYPDGDNYYISLVVNGLFDDVGECQFLHPLLCRLLRGLSILLPTADSFALTGRILAFLEIFWLTDLLQKEKPGPLLLAAAVLLFLLASLELNIFNCNFTLQASSCAATGMLSIACAQRHERARREQVVGALFLAMGYMWRREAALLTVPYLLLDTVCGVFSAENRSLALKKACRILAPCLLLTTALWLTNAAMRSDEAHRLAKEYDDSRSAISDFPTWPWKKVEAQANGELTEADYYASQWWILFDTEKMNTELFRKISAIGGRHAYPFTIRGTWDAAVGAKTTVVQNKKILRTGVLLAALSLIGLLILPGWRRLEILLSLLGTLTILLFFVMLGRVTWLAMLTVPLGLTLYVLAADKKPSAERRSRVLAGAAAALALYGLAAAAPGLKPIEPQLALNARRDVDESAFSALVESDAVYIWHKLEGRGLGVHMGQGKLPSKELLNHLVSTGDWTYGQIYFKTYLERLGIPNPAAALLERDDVFLISHDPVLLFAILEERAGGPIEAEQVGTIFDIPIYSISVKQ